MSVLENGGSRTLAMAQHWLDVGRPERCLDMLRDDGDTAASPRAFELRTAALIELDRGRDAMEQARAGLALDPENTHLLALLGIACRHEGEFADAEEALLAALRHDTENPWLLAQYATLLTQAGKLDKARRVAAAAERLAPDEPVVTHARGLIAHVEGRDAEATAIARQALAADPDSLSSHAYLGTFALVQGRIGEGARHWRTAAAMDPAHDIADVARDAKWLAHPAMVPMRLLERVGVARLWIVVLVAIVGLTMAGLRTAATVVALAYLVLVLYSWVVPPLVRRWLRRRR